MPEQLHEPTLNDHVNRAHLALSNNVVYRRFLDAVDDAGALEGSMLVDDVLATIMIRDHARKSGNVHLKDKKLASILTALRVVLWHHGHDRGDRANTVGGTLFPPEEA